MGVSLFSNGYIAIDTGFRYIKIVQVKKNKDNELNVLNFGIGDTPKGCIKNGAIQDKMRVANEISKVINEFKFNAKEAKIVMSGTNIITRIIMVDSVPEEQLDDVIWEEINSCLPVNPDEHRIDYKILGRVRENETEKIKVFVTAVAKKIIDSYIDILQILNLKPVSVDIPANSIAKFFKNDILHTKKESFAREIKYSRLKTDTIAVIDLGSETTIVNVLKNKTPEFNRVILKGSSVIDTAIFEELKLEPKQADMAERYKKMYGVVSQRNQNNDLEWQCSEAAKGVLNQIIKEIRVCFDFYIKRCSGESISRIYLVGGGSQLKGINVYFEEQLQIPVYPINVTEINGINFSSNLDHEKVNYLVNALGTAI